MAETETWRICTLALSYPPVVGGAESFAHRLNQALINRGHQVFVVTRRLRSAPAYEVLDGVPVYRTWTPDLDHLGAMAFFLGSCRVLLEQRQRFQVIHAHFFPASAIIGGVTARCLNRPIIGMCGGYGGVRAVASWPTSVYGRARLALLRRTLTRIVAVSDEVAAALQEVLNRRGATDVAQRIVTIPYGLDTQTFFASADHARQQAIRARYGLADRTVLVYTGRLRPVKNLGLILEALDILIGEGWPLHLLIVGDGIERTNLESAVRRLELEHNVTFTGYADDVANYLLASDIFVLSSQHEGFGISIIEAMAAGLPVVSTYVGGVKSVLEDGITGLAVRNSDPSTFARQLRCLLDGTVDRQVMGMRARQAVQQQFSMDAAVRRYEQLYQEVTGSVSHCKHRRD